jgi:hypothetical protein
VEGGTTKDIDGSVGPISTVNVGAKALLILGLYAALKRRSFTVAHAVAHVQSSDISVGWR